MDLRRFLELAEVEEDPQLSFEEVEVEHRKIAAVLDSRVVAVALVACLAL